MTGFVFKSGLQIVGSGGRSIGGQTLSGGALNNNIEKTKRQLTRFVEDRFGFIRSGKYVKQVADKAMQIITSETLGGKTASGTAFHSYVSEHDKWKRQRGLHAGNVNLTLSGQMIKSMFKKVRGPLIADIIIPDKRRKNITIRGQQMKQRITNARLAEIHNTGQGKQPQRRFFAIDRGSKRDREIRAFSRRLLFDEMRRQLRLGA